MSTPSPVAAKPPPPPQSQPTITALTSRNATAGTTSIAEALATSVADFVCEIQKNNGTSTSTAPPLPPQLTPIRKAANASSPQRQPRIVSLEHAPEKSPAKQKKNVAASKGSPARAAAPRTVPVSNSTPNNNCSSMSSAVADLASGMSNFFQPSSNSSKKGSDNNHTNGKGGPGNSSHSAPMISGTAAAVLALQSPFFESSDAAIVSNSGSVDNTPINNLGAVGGGSSGLGSTAEASASVPDPLQSHPLGELSGAASSPQTSPTSPGNSVGMPVPKFPTRYADGAPIIAGTAAAQMEAIATATAARITSITNEDGTSGDGFINAVASLGAGADMSQFASGGNSRSSHGFTGWGTNNGSSKILTPGATVTKRGSKALTWVDHRKMNNRNNRPAAQDPGPSYGAYQVPSPSQQNSTGGGMDILAEITSHAPPMATPTRMAQQASFTANDTTASYPQHSIPSYQEIYATQQHYLPQPQHNNQAQHVQSQGQQQQLPSNGLMSPNTQQRVSAIPSYQEIYREMGLSPEMQPQQAPPTAGQHYSLTSYSVEEVQVEHNQNNATQSNNSKSNNVSSSSGTTRTMSHHYTSRASTTHFGHVLGTKPRHHENYDGLEEGKELYTRKDLTVLGGHLHENKEVHGNMREGCDSLVVGCLDKDIREIDGLLWFLYSTDRTNGGGALCQSYHKKRPIRVFRSSLLGSKYSPPFLDVEDDVEEDSDVAFRYDGLYMVRAVWDTSGHETESFPVGGLDGWQTYFFTRVPKKPLNKDHIEAGMEYNLMGCQELWGSIQKTKGVRRLKKFEIPTPPVKLGPMKRVAISGAYKDRKCVGYVRPEPIVPAVAPPPKPPPRSKSPRTVSTEKQQEDVHESDSSSSSSEEPAPSRKPQHKEDEYSDSDSDSDSEQIKQQPKKSAVVSAPPLSAVRTPSKVIMPRPRLNSVTQSPKKTPAPAIHEDSSDSETSTSASASAPQVVQRKKRKTKPSPKMKLLNHTYDHSAFFPKRASAARAEAANRDMFKRKSSETTSLPTAAAPAAKKPVPPPRAKSTRKRAKVVPAKNYDSSSSSSEEEPAPPDVVDQSIITVGSRVLVMYKGSLFKATVRKRREKNEHHDFLIHYDGNKRTNVHWVPLDRISEILEINVNTPPKKAAPALMKKKKGGKINGKRKALPSKQESIESQPSADIGVDEVDESSRNKADESRQESMDAEPSSGTSALSRQISLQQSRYKNGMPNADASQKTENEPLSNGAAAVDVQEQLSGAHDKGTEPSTNIDEDEPNNDDVPHQNKSNPQDVPNVPESLKLKKPESEGKEAPEDQSESDTLPGSEEKGFIEDTNSIAQKHTASNLKTTTAADATARKPRKTVLSNVCHAPKSRPSEEDDEAAGLKDPLLTLAMEAEADISDGGPDENNSTDCSDHNAGLAQTSSKFKHPIGGQVYVEYRHVYYSSTILKARRKRSTTEYLVHYEGYKRSSNRWMKEHSLHEMNSVTTQRYEEQRLIPAEILYESEEPADFSMTTRRKTATKSSESTSSLDNSEQPKAQKKGPPRRLRSDASDAALEALESGVDFLPGSMVFVDWSGALYLAKMLKKRYPGHRMEYLISYDGFKSSYDSWVSIQNIYEVNPQTKRVFKQIMSDQTASDGKPKQRRAPPGPKRRETRKKSQDDEAAAIAAVASFTAAPMARTRNSSEHNNQSNSSRGSSPPVTSSIMPDVMQGIEPGVEFLPGSTLFAEYKGGLCLAKMLKKRGKGSYMEYYIQYNGLKKAEETWLSTSLVYEINPQTKRMFRQLAKK